MLTSIALLPYHARGVAFSPDGGRFLLADGGRLAIHDRDGKLLVEARVPEGERAFVYSLAWSSDDLHVATAEDVTTRLRSAADLSIVAENHDARMGPLAFCAGGKLLAAGSADRCLHVLEVPSLADRGFLKLEWGSYESFDIDHIAADPNGTFIATADYGGYSDDEWGHTASRGVPKVTIIDATTPTSSTHDLLQPQPITALELDRWRMRLLVGNYDRIVVRQLDSSLLTEWSPYGKTTVRTLGVCERFVVTTRDITWGGELTLDLWDPITCANLATIPLLAGTPRMVLLDKWPRFATPSPDGSRIVVPEPDGVRLWAVDG